MPSSSDINNNERAVSDTVNVIGARKGWSVDDLIELWSFRELVYAMMIRSIKIRYKQTVMGVAWSVIQPVVTMLIFTLIFGRLAKIPSDGYPYPIFVFSGLLAWNFFSSSVSGAGLSLMTNTNLVSKVYFPRIILPISTIGVSLVDFIIACGILLFMMLIYGQPLSYKVIYLPVFFAGLIIVSIGTGAWLAAVTVTYRDFRYVITYMLQIWMYLTPVIYPITFVPESWRWLLYLNPIYAWISGIRACFLNQPIDHTGVLVSMILSLVIFSIGMFYFQKVQHRFADII